MHAYCVCRFTCMYVKAKWWSAFIPLYILWQGLSFEREPTD